MVGRERFVGHLYESGYKKNMKNKEQYSPEVQSSTDKKLTTMQDRQTLQSSDEKQYRQYWILRLIVSNYIARKQSSIC